jgi:hypothetical protein
MRGHRGGLKNPRVEVAARSPRTHGESRGQAIGRIRITICLVVSPLIDRAEEMSWRDRELDAVGARYYIPEAVPAQGIRRGGAHDRRIAIDQMDGDA